MDSGTELLVAARVILSPQRTMISIPKSNPSDRHDGLKGSIIESDGYFERSGRLFTNSDIKHYTSHRHPHKRLEPI